MNNTLTADLQTRNSLMTVKEVIALLGVHQQTVYEWVWAGKIPSVRIGSRIKFDPRALALWMQAGQLG
jgi:excisionase family DNA binding protein